jgi:hypothetical protein
MRIGIILSSSFVTKELELDFGRITPSELPLGNKYLYHYQKEFLMRHCDEVYLTQPYGYAGFLGSKDVIEINDNNTILDVFKLLFEKFSNDELIILYGDTLVLEDLNQELLGKSDIVFTYQGSNFNYDWASTLDNNLVVGFFVFKNNLLIKKYVSEAKNFNDFITNVSKDVKFVNCNSWMDFGQKRTYSYNKIKFLETRGFNSISYVNGFISKKSIDWFKMYAEYYWLNRANNFYSDVFTPVVRDFNSDGIHASYKVEYKDYVSLSDKFTFGKFDLEYESKVIKELVIFLKSRNKIIPTYTFNDTFISQKLSDRVKQIKSDLLLEYDLFEISERVVNYFRNKPMQYGFFHGDVCYSNILFDTIEDRFIFIDPRGYLEKCNGFSIIGPRNYDLYKLAHSFVCGYDKVISFNYVSDIIEMKRRFNIFCKISDMNEEELKYGLIQLFISMIPLHSDNESRQQCFAIIAKQIWNEL